MRTLLSGFDDRGKVYDLGDVIERTIDDAHRDSVASLHRIFKERRLVESVARQETVSAEVFAEQVGKRETVLVHGP